MKKDSLDDKLRKCCIFILARVNYFSNPNSLCQWHVTSMERTVPSQLLASLNLL